MFGRSRGGAGRLERRPIRSSHSLLRCTRYHINILCGWSFGRVERYKKSSVHEYYAGSPLRPPGFSLLGRTCHLYFQVSYNRGYTKRQHPVFLAPDRGYTKTKLHKTDQNYQVDCFVNSDKIPTWYSDMVATGVFISERLCCLPWPLNRCIARI